MSEEKKRNTRNRDYLERSRYNELEKSRRTYEEHLLNSQEKKADEERRKILEENQKMIDAHDQAKKR